jgi:hypothetical protein
VLIGPQCDEQRPVCGNCKTYYSSRIQKCDYDHPSGPIVNRPALPPVRNTRNGDASGGKERHVTFVNPNMSMTLPRKRPLLPSTVGGVVLDPFNTSARSDLPSADQLLHHCKFPPPSPCPQLLSLY